MMYASVHALQPPAVAPPPVDLDGDGSFAEMMHEVGLALDADALVVSWHGRDGERSVLLFAEGNDANLEAAAMAPLAFGNAFDHAPHSAWTASAAGEGGELTTSIPTSAGVVTITGRFRRLGSRTRTHARDAVARLLPMVRPFVRLWAERAKMLSRVRGLTAAVNKSDVGVLLVNRFGQLLFANDAAEVLLAESDGIRRQGRLLSGARLADTLRLQAAIEHAITAHDHRGIAMRGPVVALDRVGRRPLLAAVVASETAASEAGESAAILYLCDPDEDLTPLIESTCRLYGLSPVETRLTCHLAKGISLIEAADAMHVREQTARSYLKQVFLKTETRRQAELVWLMLKSSVRTLSHGHARLA